MNDLIGRKLLNRYRVEGYLGRGAMAEVYRVYDEARMVDLAMKMMNEDLAVDRVFMRRFEREARTLAKLQHPNIVRFYGLHGEDTNAFMLLDFVEGDTLMKEIFRAGGPVSTDLIRTVFRAVCGALQYAHGEGFVHCDIKSANIMLDQNEEAYLADFGIARMTDAATATMVGAGTPAYMPPEQVKGKEPIPQTDIYALGIVLYEMVTGGERPFDGESAAITGSTSIKVRWEQVNLKPPSPRIFNSNVPKAMEAVILKCLEKEPSRRYQSALDLLNAVEVALGETMKTRKVQPDAERVPKKQPSIAKSEKAKDRPSKSRLPRKKTPARQQDKKERGVIPIWGWGLGAGLLLIVMILGLGGVNETSLLVTVAKTSTPTQEPTTTPARTATTSTTITLTPTATLMPSATALPEGFVLVPDVVGMMLNDGIDTLTEVGIEVIQESQYAPNEEKYLILAQSPSDGDIVAEGGFVTIYYALPFDIIYQGSKRFEYRWYESREPKTRSQNITLNGGISCELIYIMEKESQHLIGAGNIIDSNGNIIASVSIDYPQKSFVTPYDGIYILRYTVWPEDADGIRGASLTFGLEIHCWYSEGIT